MTDPWPDVDYAPTGGTVGEVPRWNERPLDFRLAKRTLDLAIALPLFLLTVPLQVAIALLIGGGVAAAGSGGFMLAARSTYSSVQSQQQPTVSAVEALDNKGKTYGNVAAVLGVAAAALLVVGVPLFFATSSPSP